jgi:DNA-binding NarL/FixJ family response regulator
MIRIFLTDDHPLVIDGIKLMISEAADMECVGAANNGKEALQQLPKLKVDLLLLDINMDEMNGLETCRAVHTRYPEIKIIVLSMLKEPSMVKHMLRNGASGYLLKNAGKSEILEAIRRVHSGKRYYSSEVASAVMDSLSHDAPKSDNSLFPELTRREKQVLRLIVDEYTTSEIAEELSIKFGTVETHRRNLLTKLGARNTAGLVRTCLEYGLLDAN